MSGSRSLGQLALFDYTFRVRARLHRFLLIVLMLTLPVQAFAYATMQGCVQPNQATAEPTEQMAMADCHMSGHSSDPSGQHAPVQHECKFCAACGLASAMPIDFVASMPAMPVPHSFALPPAISFSGFIPDGPERPPRATLA